jgi:hypothetical protein
MRLEGGNVEIFAKRGKTACAPARNGYSYPFRNG